MNIMVACSRLVEEWNSSFMEKRLINLFAVALLVLGIVNSAGADVVDCLVQPHRVAKVGASTTGIIRHVPVARGDMVKKGQLLAHMEDDLERISFKLSKIRLNYLRAKTGRLHKLNEQSMASEEATQQAETELESEKAELERWRVMVDQKSILSPIDGVIAELLLAEGESVHEQSPLMVVASIDPLYVELLVPMSMYRDIKAGMQAEVTLEESIGGTYIADVIVTDRMIDAASATFGVRLNLPNPGLQIPAGVNCQARFLDSTIGDPS